MSSIRTKRVYFTFMASNDNDTWPFVLFSSHNFQLNFVISWTKYEKKKENTYTYYKHIVN